MPAVKQPLIRLLPSFVIRSLKLPRVIWEHLRTRIKVRGLLSDENRNVFIEVGAGARKGRGSWITIDITRQADLFWDLRNGIPFPAESVDQIYSSHFFEHLTYKQSQDFLGECLRVLKPNGKFSICVPNTRLYVDAYINNTAVPDRVVYSPALNNTTKIDLLNYIAYMDGEHKYMFDEENLIHILKNKGFRSVGARAFDPTLDLMERDATSIYAEAVK